MGLSLADIAFPHRRGRSYGVTSFALLFLTLFAEIEGIVLIALGLVARRFDLLIDFQPLIVPADALVSLAAAGVFAWRARTWSKRRIARVRQWGTAASTYSERLAQQHRTHS